MYYVLHIFPRLNIGLNKNEFITFVGGGGKTTSIFKLAKELKELNRSILITTTTAMYVPDKKNYDYFFLEKTSKKFKQKKPSITVYGGKIENRKIKNTDVLELENIFFRGQFDYILVEGDGSKGKPIKAPEAYEPVVPKNTTKTIGVIGLDSLGRKINEENVHRVEKLKNIVKANSNEKVDNDVIIRLVLNKNGLFKDSQGEKILFLNKAIDKERIKAGLEIRRKLNEKGFHNVVVGDIKTKKIY